MVVGEGVMALGTGFSSAIFERGRATSGATVAGVSIVGPAGFWRPKKRLLKSFFGVLMSYLRAGKKENGPNRS